MKKKYYSNYFSAMLPTNIVCSLIVACSRASEQYDMPHSHNNRNFHTKHDTSRQTYNTTTLPQTEILEQLFEAINQSNTQKVKDILEQKFKEYSNIIDLKNFCYKNNILHIVAKNSKNKALQAIMKLLLDKLKPTLMHVVCRLDLTDLIERMIEHFEISECDKKNNTDGMHLNRRNTNLFLQKDSLDKTPLLVAAESENIEILEYLLEAIYDSFSFVPVNDNKKSKYWDEYFNPVLVQLKSFLDTGNSFKAVTDHEKDKFWAIFNHKPKLNDELDELIELLYPLYQYVGLKIPYQHQLISDTCITINGSLDDSIASSTNSHDSNENTSQNWSIKQLMQENIRPLVQPYVLSSRL